MDGFIVMFFILVVGFVTLTIAFSVHEKDRGVVLAEQFPVHFSSR